MTRAPRFQRMRSPPWRPKRLRRYLVRSLKSDPPPTSPDTFLGFEEEDDAPTEIGETPVFEPSSFKA